MWNTEPGMLTSLIQSFVERKESNPREQCIYLNQRPHLWDEIRRAIRVLPQVCSTAEGDQSRRVFLGIRNRGHAARCTAPTHSVTRSLCTDYTLLCRCRCEAEEETNDPPFVRCTSFWLNRSGRDRMRVRKRALSKSSTMCLLENMLGMRVELVVLLLRARRCSWRCLRMHKKQKVRFCCRESGSMKAFLFFAKNFCLSWN